MNQFKNATPGVIDSQIYGAICKVKPSLEGIRLMPETRFDSLGLQSIERTTVVFELEELFDVSIVDANLDTFDTVAEARALVMKLLAAGESA